MAPGVAAARGSRVGGASDQALLSATRAGSDEAFLVLYDRYRDLAWRVARSVSSTDLDAEDAVAEAFSRIYSVVGDRDIGSFRSYLAATVRNAATDAHRLRERPQAGADLVEPPATGPSVEERVIDFEEKARVGRAFAALPERYRTALWLSEVESFSTREVGHVLGTTANGAAALALRARERLREAYLGEHLRDPLDPACAAATQGLAPHVRGTASRRASRRVEAHVAGCSRCASRLGELRHLNESLAAVVPAVPATLLVGNRVLDRAHDIAPLRPVPDRAATGSEAGTRVTEMASGFTQAAAPLVSSAPGLSERMLQPIAAAVAGLVVAGSASIGTVAFDRGAAAADPTHDSVAAEAQPPGWSLAANVGGARDPYRDGIPPGESPVAWSDSVTADDARGGDDASSADGDASTDSATIGGTPIDGVVPPVLGSEAPDPDPPEVPEAPGAPGAPMDPEGTDPVGGTVDRVAEIADPVGEEIAEETEDPLSEVAPPGDAPVPPLPVGTVVGVAICGASPLR